MREISEWVQQDEGAGKPGGEILAPSHPSGVGGTPHLSDIPATSRRSPPRRQHGLEHLPAAAAADRSHSSLAIAIGQNAIAEAAVGNSNIAIAVGNPGPNAFA